MAMLRQAFPFVFGGGWWRGWGIFCFIRSFMQTPFTPELIQQTFIPYVIREYAASLRIPAENMTVEYVRDYITPGFINRLRVRMAEARSDEKTVTKTEESLPSTLTDWVKFHLRRLLGERLPGWFAYNTTPVITTITHYNEYNTCPHIAVEKGRIHGHLQGCVRFMQYGSDFRGQNDKARAAAQQILKHAVEADLFDIRNPPYDLLRAIRDYKDACR